MTSLRVIYWQFAIALTIAVISPVAMDGADQDSIDKAHGFLKTGKQGKEILGFLHFGADYLGHEYYGMKTFDDGSFVLGYRFRWRTTEPGYTNVAFFCDSYGNVRRVGILDTDAVFNRPFAFANLSIKVLGQLLVDEYRGKLSEGDRRRLQQFVNDADAHAFLEWWLKLEQFFGN